MYTGDYVTKRAIKETRSFTITGAVDPATGNIVDVQYAIENGIIDQANGKYIGQDRFGCEMVLPISEAIKRGLIIADSSAVKPEEVKPRGPKYLQETQTMTVKSVVDPIRGQEISVSEAIHRGFLDQGRAQYINPITGQWILKY